MAHKCGFTQRSLTQSIRSVGFPALAAARRSAPYFDIWVVASKTDRADSALRDLALRHFPGMV
jgi:hypothetical protein